MSSTIYGYVRVSTKEQCEDRQMIALRQFPVHERNIFMDKAPAAGILTGPNIAAC